MIMITVETGDYHTAGEPFRIVRPQATISGQTVAERRVFAIGDANGTIALGAWAIQTGLVTPDPSG
jgi:hypothetical protein